MTRHLPALLPLVALGACDNARVTVSDTGWHSVPMGVAQLPADARFLTTLLSEGNGAVVGAGELVQPVCGGSRANNSVAASAFSRLADLDLASKGQRRTGEQGPQEYQPKTGIGHEQCTVNLNYE
jgi:hypothetical protein